MDYDHPILNGIGREVTQVLVGAVTPGCRMDKSASRDRRMRSQLLDGAGLGAFHQTAWTGLVAKLIQQQGALGSIDKSDAGKVRIAALLKSLF